MNDLPIGVFDSGVGGLTVLRALAKRWPGEKFIYLADTARLPYGTKSPETIEQYLIQNLKFFLQYGVKAIVVACNSASSVLLERRIPCPVPILNVITPGAKLAAQATKTKKIGVLGTRATVLSQAYVHAIQKIDPSIEVQQQACPLLVPLVEENWIDDPLTNMVIYRYLQDLLKQPIDTLVLGCTHYPVLKNAFQKVVGSSVELIDSPLGIIAELERDFKLSVEKDCGEIHVVATDLTTHLEQLIASLILPLKPKSVKLVDLGRK
jgi:glutamate racemase